MDQEKLATQLGEIRQLLSHLHGEVTTLEKSYYQVLRVLRNLTQDSQTGFLKESAFFDQWKKFLGTCEQTSKDCGILLVDIDEFDEIRRIHGESTGDEVIERIADLLKHYTTPECLVARTGEGQFAVAMQANDPELVATAEILRRRAERLHGRVAKQPQVEWKCTLSAGLASARKAGFDAPRLLQAARGALQEAKKRGRNQVRAA